jgi:inorganic pyrophosphatase
LNAGKLPDTVLMMADSTDETHGPPPTVEVVIEIPRGSFLKRGSNGHIDFVSPFPCPYNYGSIHQYIGGEGDFLDAIVLGPRLAVGSRVIVNAYGAVGLSERFMYDDKLVCAQRPLTAGERRGIVKFFHIYAFCKGALNQLRGQPGRSRCEGWGDASAAIARAVPVEKRRQKPLIEF